ncbi:MAG TPA: hypothetical protein VF870_14015 [Ignavibacteriaceae bacterium]
MNEFDAANQYLLNHYEQLAAAVELFLESPSDCKSAYLEMMQKSLSDLKEFKSGLSPLDEP